MADRDLTTRRMAIINAYVAKLKGIDGTGDFIQNVSNNVENRMQFWDEVKEYPHINVTAGPETRRYQASNFKWRFMSMTIRAYVKDEDDPTGQLEELLEDIETVLESNNRIQYTDKQGNTQKTSELTIDTLDTDEGVMKPLAIAELVCEVRY